MTLLHRSIIKIFTLLPFIMVAPTAFSHEKLEMAVGEWPPYVSQNQKHNGVIAHIISDIFNQIGLETNFHFLPWSRAYSETSKGKYDASAVWMHKDEREEYFIYSDAILTEQFVFFHNKTLKFDWQSMADLKGLRVGSIYGYSYGPELDDAFDKKLLIKTEVTSPEQNFKMLLHNRIDIMPFELNVGNSILKDQFSPSERYKIIAHPKPLLLNSSYVLFPKALEGSKKLSQQFSQKLKEMKESGQYDLYFKKLKEGFYNLNSQSDKF